MPTPNDVPTPDDDSRQSRDEQKMPDLSGENMSGGRNPAADPFAELLRSLRREERDQELDHFDRCEQNALALSGSVTPWLAPPVDDAARELLQMSIRGELPTTVSGPLERLAHYYPEWDDALAAAIETVVAVDDFLGELPGPRPAVRDDVTLPPAYTAAVEAGDLMRMSREADTAPPLNDGARLLIAKMVDGTLVGEMRDRVIHNIERHLEWELAARDAYDAAKREFRQDP